MKERCIAIVLAAGQGKRMGGTVHKQYLDLGGKPILAHTLKVFEDSDLIDEVLLVTGADERAGKSAMILYGMVCRTLTRGKRKKTLMCSYMMEPDPL